MTEPATAHETGTTFPADWAEDYDLYDSSYLADPFSVWRQMRQQCPVARTSRRGGGWMLSRYADITSAALDTGAFSSRAVEVTGPVPGPGRELPLPPVTSDPPGHAADRKLLLPLFSRKAVARFEGLTRETAARLIESFSGRDEVDAASEFARDIPVVVTSRMLGLPRADEENFHRWTVQMLKDGAEDYEVRAAAVSQIRGYFTRLVAGPKAPGNPGIINYLRERGGRRSHADRRAHRRDVIPHADSRNRHDVERPGAALWHLATTSVRPRRPGLGPSAHPCRR